MKRRILEMNLDITGVPVVQENRGVFRRQQAAGDLRRRGTDFIRFNHPGQTVVLTGAEHLQDFIRFSGQEERVRRRGRGFPGDRGGRTRRSAGNQTPNKQRS